MYAWLLDQIKPSSHQLHDVCVMAEARPTNDHHSLVGASLSEPHTSELVLKNLLRYTVLPAYCGHFFCFCLMMMFSHVGWASQVIWS